MLIETAYNVTKPLKNVYNVTLNPILNYKITNVYVILTTNKVKIIIYNKNNNKIIYIPVYKTKLILL